MIGLMSSMMRQVPEGRLHIRPFQWHLHGLQKDPRVELPSLLASSTCLTPFLEWWQAREHTLIGVSLLPFCPSVRLYTDSSNQGWGAHLESQTRGGPRQLGQCSPGEQGHKLEGTQSSSPGPDSLPSTSDQSVHPSGHRQHDGSGLCQQPGGNQVSVPHGTDLATLPVVQDSPVANSEPDTSQDV